MPKLSKGDAALLPTACKLLHVIKNNLTLLHDPHCAEIKGLLEAMGVTVPPKPEDTPEESAPAPTPVPAAAAAPAAAEEEAPEEPDYELIEPEIEPPPEMPPKRETEDDWEGAGTHKEAASEAKGNGNFSGAVVAYTKALFCQASAMTFAARAECLLQMKRPSAAVADCDAALGINPDSAKALRTKGKALRFLGNWEESYKSLSKAQSIDFDDSTVPMLKLVEGKAKAIFAKQAKERLKREAEEKEKQRERARKAAADKAAAASSARSSTSGGPRMPGGMGGGMPPGMEGLFSDPELMAAMQKPKVMAALQGLMGGDPSAIARAMADPEVGPILMKLQSKMGGMMDGMGGMGGMGGMPEEVDPDHDEGDLPDLEETPDLD
jgi:suppressor of tumorigenicity protein 13